MGLRLRLSLAVAGLVALAIALASTAAYVLTARQLHDEIDTFLARQAEAVVPARFGEGPRGPRVVATVPGLRGADTVAQGLTRDGVVVRVPDEAVRLPVNQLDREIASGRQSRQLRSETINGVDFRIITTPQRLGQVAAVQIGRELTETRSVLAALRQRLVLVGLGGTAVAALLAWLLAARIARPIRQVSDAAEHVAATQQLSARIRVESTDEVGRLATSMNTMLTALQTSRQQQQRLVMDASHELRTPLTSVRTNVDILRRVENLEPEDRLAILGDLDREVTQLTDLVSELVDLATSTQGSDEPRQQLEVEVLVDDVAGQTRRRTGREITVVVDRPGVVSGQRAVLERAVSNLVTNACKFSPPGEPVSIRVDGGMVAVQDRGPGIAPADRPHVFERFYRATSARDEPGSGLGLAIVADAVTAHGGSVFADTAPGGGAVVGFSLPEVDPG